MYLTDLVISGLLSLSVTGLLAVAAAHTGEKRRDDFFSASLGIIIFVCVKSIVTDCGWGFAALFGLPDGPLAHLCLTLGAFFFFHELRRSHEAGMPQREYHPADSAALLCFTVGRHMMCDEMIVADLSLYLLGEAAELALMTTAVQLVNREEQPLKVMACMERAAVMIGLKTAVCTVLRQQTDGRGTFLGVMVLTIGLAGTVSAFADAIRSEREVKAGGFAAGFTVALCMTTLFG